MQIARARWFLARIACCSILVGLAGAQGTLGPREPAQLAWIENGGQFATPAALVAFGGGQILLAERGAIGLALPFGDGRAVYVRLAFTNASESCAVAGEDRLPGIYSYFLGNDPSCWRTGLPSFRRAVMKDLYPGVDLVLRDEGGQLEYDLLLAPGADASRIRVRCEGAVPVQLAEDGAIELVTELGILRQEDGLAWEVLPDGGRRELVHRWRVEEGCELVLELEAYDSQHAVVVDPGLVWASYIGGKDLTTGDVATSAAVDSNGDVTVTGWAAPAGFPITPGAFTYVKGSDQNVFVTRLDGDTGAVIYSTLIGGVGGGRGEGVAVDSSGRATVVGTTWADDFPVTPGAFDNKKQSQVAGYVLRLSPLGTALEFSTFLEGQLGSQPYDVALAPDSSAIVAGSTSSPDFPTTPGAFQTVSPNGYSKGFVTRFNYEGSGLIWSTFITGSGTEELYSIRSDTMGRITATGVTSSKDFPVTPGAYSTTYPAFPCSADGQAFVSRLSADGSTLEWSTYLGGCKEDIGLGVDLLPDGGTIVAGVTRSFDFPVTPGAVKTVLTDPYFVRDGFVTRFDPSGSNLVYSTYLGGNGEDWIRGVVVDVGGVATVVGTGYGDYPTTPGAYSPLQNGTEQFVVSRLDPAGRRILYSTFIGGMGVEHGLSLARLPRDRIASVGMTTGGFPTTPASFSPSYNGGQTDGVVAVLDMLPTGVRRFGFSTPACQGEITLGITTMPVGGSPRFALWASGTPPNSKGFLVVSMAPLAGPLSVHGIDLWLQHGGILTAVPATSDALGYVEVPYPLNANASGDSLFFQLVMQNSAGCGGAGTLSASDALAVNVQ